MLKFRNCNLLRICLIVICFHFVFHTTVQAQQFEWASSGNNLNGGVRASVIDRKGNLIVAGQFQPGYGYQSERSLYSSTGQSVAVTYGNEYMFMASYSPEGKINWLREFRGADDPIGMGLDADGNVVVLASNRNNPTFPELGIRVDNARHFIMHLSPQGKAMKIVTDTLNLLRDPIRFAVSNQGGYIVTQSEHTLEPSGSGVQSVNWMTLVKLNPAFTLSWKQRIRLYGSHGYFLPGMLFDEARNGDIYGVLAVREAAGFGEKKFMAPATDSIDAHHGGFESYLVSYNKNGKQKWVKRSGAKTIFSAIKVSENSVYLGGNIQNQHDFFGKAVDTSGRKAMVLARFSLSGRLQWVQATQAHTIKALTTDQHENVYAVVESKIGYPQKMIFYSDTLSNVFQSLLIASFDEGGRFRWIKHTRLPMSTNEFPNLITTECGDIFVSGELWWVMKAEMKWFDAALVKGYGYGPMPFVGKINNTLPAFVPRDKPGECVVSPAPWAIRNFPNPFKGATTVEYKTTYRDENISLQLYSINGSLVKTYFTRRVHDKGTYTYRLQAEGLASGVYVLVLRGTVAVATAQILVQ